jgi:hypothetical protein
MTMIRMIQRMLMRLSPPFEVERVIPGDRDPKRRGRLAGSSEPGGRMVRAFVVYDTEPDPERYEQHAELCRTVPGSTFRHGRIFGAPMGEPDHRYYAEWEFADMDAFKAAARTDEFMATGKDAMEMGVPFHVNFAQVD